MHIVPNGKRYIGQTKGTPTIRWGSNGVRYKKMFFYRAIEKYGWENIQHIIIAENLTLKEANDMELKLINEYQTTNPQYGYNCHQGGNNHKVNEITRLKMSIAQQGENNNFYGHKHSDEHKKKMSLRQSGKNNSFYGKHHKPETIEKIRINSQGRKMSAELNINQHKEEFEW